MTTPQWLLASAVVLLLLSPLRIPDVPWDPANW
jgi:hypothetical protein